MRSKTKQKDRLAYARRSNFLVISAVDVGQKSHLTCTLDSLLQLALMLCACAGGTTGKDLSAFAADVLAKTAGFLVIDVIDLILAEGANFSSSAVGVLGTGSARGALLFNLFIHYIKPYLSLISAMADRGAGMTLWRQIK